MKTLLCGIFWFCMCLGSFVHAQSDVDTTYIRSYVDKIIIKANLDNKNDAFIVTNDDTNFNLNANSQNKLFLSLDYEFIGVSLGIAPSFLPNNNEDDRKGSSQFTDFQFRFFLGNWTQNLKYGRVQGFYVENTSDFLADWNASVDPFIQFPNLTVTNYSGSTAYVLNSQKFSLRNVVYNTEWQLKSAGSFVPELAYSYSILSATVQEQNLRDRLMDVGISARYFYTLVWRKNWFLTANVAPSIGLRFSKSENTNLNQVENDTYYPLGIGGNAQVGYSSKRWIFGLTYEFQSTHYNEDRSTHITNDYSYAKLYVGYRLDAPGFISSLFKKFNKKLGL